MASTPDVSYLPDHPSSSIGSTINSGSDGSSSPSRSRRARSESRESSPGPDPLIILQGDDLNEYLKEQRLLAANRGTNQGDAVSHPFLHDFSLNQGNSASDNGDGEDMTDEEFFAQFGEGMPEWANQPLDATPQVQGDGDGDDLMELNAEDFNAQLDAELAAEIENDPMEITEVDLERQLNKELWAEARQKKAAEDTQDKANLQEAMRVSPKNDALAIEFDQNNDLNVPTTEELEAALEAELNGELTGGDAGDVADGTLGNIRGTLSVMSTLQPKINPCTVKSCPKPQSKKRTNKKAKTAAPKSKPKPKPKSKKPPPGTTKKPPPQGARVGRSKPPPMRRTDDLPELYHHHNPINWSLLLKHMNLSTRVDLNHCYKSLGLDVGRGKAVYEDLKAHLRIPGNSVDLSANNISTNDAKKVIARIAHKLLVAQGWGQKHFNRPSYDSGCKYILFGKHSTEVFLEFTSLVYKAMKLEEKRKKGKAKQQEERDAAAAVQHPTAQTFATATYCSPRAVVQPQPQPSPAPAPPAPRTVATKPLRSQAFVDGAIVAPRSVAPCPINGSIDPLLAEALSRFRAAQK